MARTRRSVQPPLSTPAPPSATGLVERMEAEPWWLNFVSTVRNLERSDSRRPRVGTSADPTVESIRFRRSTESKQSSGEVDQIRAADERPAEVVIARSGPTCLSDLLPRHLIERVHDQVDRGDPTVFQLLEAIDARLIGLTYRAWAETRAVTLRERAVTTGRPDSIEAALLDLAGFDWAGDPHNSPLPREVFAEHAELLSLPPRPVAGLEPLLLSAFGLAVRVEQFRHQHVALPDDEASRVGRETVPNVTSLVLLQVGPVGQDDLQVLLHEGGLRLILLMTRHYLGDLIDAEVEILLRRSEVSQSCWGGPDEGPILGVATWLGGSGPSPLEDGTIVISRSVCTQIESGAECLGDRS